MSEKKINYYEATEAFGTMLDGEQITVHAGEYVPAGHPLLKRRMDHFKPVESFGRFDAPGRSPSRKKAKAKKAKAKKAEPKVEPKAEPKVEQATAAPGEQRGDR
jgi:hypothetical protein